MIDTASSISAISSSLAAQAATPAAQHTRSGTHAESGSFAAELRDAIGRVDQRIAESGTLTERLLRGEDVELHTVALRAQEAQMSFDLFLQIRNRLIQGYQEIMRMQV
jgi:flagellar hook-basal body complex protein FliE